MHMKKHVLLGRIYSTILIVATFQILLMDIFYYYILDAVPEEFKYILIYPLPMAYGVVGAFLVILYFYVHPILRFIEAEEAGEKPGESDIFKIQSRLMNLPYFVAGMSFPAFITGGLLAAVIINYKMGWPMDTWFYGLFGGILAGILAIPQAIFAVNWAVYPVLQQTIPHVSKLEASRTAGYGVSLRNKFVMSMLAVVLAISGYCVVLGYSQTDLLLTNMKKMERLLTPEVSETLVSEIDGVADTRVRSSRYFMTRMGSLKIFFVGLMLFGLVVAMLVSVAVAGQITRPISTLQAVTEKIKDGVYDKPVGLITNDEFAELGRVFNQMTNDLLSQLDRSRSMLGSIRDAVETLAPMSRELVAIAEQEASGANQQASAAEQAASTCQEISAVARQIAENAGKVADSAEGSLKITQEGQEHLDYTRKKFDNIDETMKKTVLAMMRLGKQSQEIEDIVKIINNISDQTKLLALNASLEAAGAGEQGARFGVVADQVRRLAQKTAETTKKIHDIINRMREAVDTSTGLADEGDKAVSSGRVVIEEMAQRLIAIFNSSTEATRHLKEIDLMTSQQATASEQMVKTVAEVKDSAIQGSSAAGEMQSSLREIESLLV